MKKKLRHFIAFFLAFSIVFSIIAPIMAKSNINVIYAESATEDPPPPPPPQPPSPTPPPIPPLPPPEEEEEEGTPPDDDKDKQNKNDGTKTNKVTLHKLLMTKAELNAWDSDAIKDAGYNGTQSKDKLNDILKKLNDKQANLYEKQQNVMLTNFGVNGVKEIAGVFFVLKNEDGTKYIGRDGNEKEQDFVLTDDNKSEVIGGVTGVEGYTFDVSNLNGTEDNPKVYTIVEVPELSTYKSDNGETLTGSKAVPVKISLPFINEHGIQDNVNVYPKNSADKPQIDKNFKANNELNIVKDNFFALGKVGANYNNYGANKSTASATIGDEIPYEIKTQIPKDAKYKTLRWEDTMTKGLTFNKKVEVQYTHVSNLTGEKIWVELVEKFYDLSINENGFIIKLNDDGLNKIKEEAKISDVEIKLTYSAVVNKNAEVDVEDTNTVKLFYGNSSKLENNPDSLIPTSPKVVTGGKKFVKTDDTDTKTRLVGAEFVIKNNIEGDKNKGKYLVAKNSDNILAKEESVTTAKTALKTAIDAYNKLKADQQKDEEKKKINDAQDAYIKALKEKLNKYEWGDKADAVKLVSNADGQFEIKGLAYGNYQLEEIKAPEGYALSANLFDFTIVKDSYKGSAKGLQKSPPHIDGYQQIINNPLTIPQTGGIGTVIFVVVGLIIMGGAVLAMKKRSSEDK